MKTKIVVAMSGGVDSSVAAALLQKQGHDVIGVTMQVWQDTQEAAIKDAKTIAKKLAIPHYVLDLRKSFEKQVISYFTNEYLRGRTPNPCVVCNRYIKFGELLNWAQSMGADYLATGHYAKIVKEQDRYLLKKSGSATKDQTYPLYSLKQEQLSHVIFPLADFEKTETRKIAATLNLPVANKPDSQDICFVVNQNYVSFIEEKTGIKIEHGNFVDKSGNILGKHRGLHHYTIGQRKGLGVATGKPVFISSINVDKNEIILGEEKDILSKELIAIDVNFISIEKLIEPIEASAKIRYGTKDAAVTIFPNDNNSIRMVFKEPQKAVTPGQSVVFYQGDFVLGGGVIQ